MMKHIKTGFKILVVIAILTPPLWLGREKKRPVVVAKKSKSDMGTASYYADKFEGRKTANGEVFDNDSMTAAHNTLPLGTLVKVTNLSNGRSVIVKITDRLHATNSRIIDLTQTAARELGFLTRGLARVRVERV
ncbi:rare lipoprotein A [Chitinophaga rupis]|uniref:Probable endolytic peptidoglycan transglycosylase RlpA n=1 Tax=Chitinophaga rupis TaxID=573321 RepID=A0A1H7W4H4_9BACT|nr:septal ring lytic transglycosylase RlpA family protein [Chitinophaga rupis]SEM16400.1 rare lipoprotein A [Chitinophaga rupis]